MSLKNRLGFTLVELMIVVGLLAGVSLVVMNITKQANKTSKKFQTDTDADFLMREIAGILADQTNCSASLIKGQNYISTAAGIITSMPIPQPSPTAPLPTGKYLTTSAGGPSTGYGSSGIQITSYTISQAAIVGATSTETGLVINFALPKLLQSNAAGAPTTIKPRIIKLVVTTDASNNILTCKSSFSNAYDLWQQISGSNDIWYTAGKVGIGTTSPTEQLRVNSLQPAIASFYSSNIGQEYIVVGHDGSSNGIMLGYDVTLHNGQIGNYGNGVAINIDQNNNVGIGTVSPLAKLDINGETKIGNTGLGCSLSVAGAMRYNAGAMEFCNGTAWTAMGGSIVPVIHTNSVTSSGHFAVQVSCGAGGVILGGGCYDSCFLPDGGNGNTALVVNYPLNATTWRCGSRDIINPCTRNLVAYAICTQ